MSDQGTNQAEISPSEVIRLLISDEEFASLNEVEQGIVRRNFYNRELLLLARQLARLRIAMHVRITDDYWEDYLHVIRNNDELKDLVRNMAMTWLHTDAEALSRIADYQERYNIGL